jgi:hypothetical protein
MDRTIASPLTLSLSHEGRGNAAIDTKLKAPRPSWERGCGEGASMQCALWRHHHIYRKPHAKF